MEHEENIQSPNESAQTLAAKDLGGELMLQSRIDEQSTLTCILKKRADEILLRYQALQKLNSDLEDQVAQSQKELANEKKKSEILATRFTYLADNNQGIISFMKEHKNQNAKLQVENRQLQLENDSLFSQKLQDKEALVEKLVQENKLLREKCALNEKKSREILAGYESKLREKEVQHQAKEESLLKQLNDAQRKHKEALESCNDLKHKLGEAKEEHKLKEIEMTETIATLTRGKGKLLENSRERGKVIQETQEQIQKLERKLKEEEKARVQVQERFASEAEAVNADRRVKSLTAALDRSTSELQELQKDFDAFKKYSAKLLTKERELNRKLCYINF